MAVLYPPVQPTLSGDILTISRFLNSPTLIARRLRTLAEQRFISDVLLQGRYNTDSGSVVYEVSEGIYSDRAPKSVQPMSEYPLTPISTGTPSIAKTVKWGNDAEISDESISRQLMNPVEKAFIKLVNQMVKTIDGVSMAAIASAVTQTSAAGSTWASGSPNILRDIAKAKANIIALNQGYDPDTVVVDDITFANIISDPAFALLLSRENGNQPVYSGNFPIVDGMRLLPSPNIVGAGTTGAKALVVDTKVLGGMADENLGGPGYVASGGVGVQAKTIREDKTDGWRIRTRRVTVPIIQEPAAAWFITGVEA
jgi:hypothetical protein